MMEQPTVILEENTTAIGKSNNKRVLTETDDDEVVVENNEDYLQLPRRESANTNNNKKCKKDEPDEIVFLKEKLAEWGINPQENQQHAKLFNDYVNYMYKCLQQLQQYKQPKADDNDDNKVFTSQPSPVLIKLPYSDDYIETIKFIMKEDITISTSHKTHKKVIDQLLVTTNENNKYNNNNKYRNNNNRTRYTLSSPPYRWNKDGKLVLKDEFQDLIDQQYQQKLQDNDNDVSEEEKKKQKLFDPLIRFKYKEVSAMELLRKQLLYNVKYPFGYEYNTYRAIAAHKACQDYIPCINCGTLGSIHYNTLHTTNTNSEKQQQQQQQKQEQPILYRHWNKLICTNCGSYYEIRVAESESIAFSKLDSYCDNGGKYDKYVGVQEYLKKDSKQYLTIIVTKPQYQNNKWHVYVAEIQRIMPLLKDKSFINDNGKIRIYTRIETVPQTRKLWFSIPYFKFNIPDLAKEVLDSKEEQGEEEKVN